MDREITYTKAALKVLKAMPANASKLVRDKVRQFAANPDELANNVVALKGRLAGLVRLRIGDWRVVIEESTLTVIVIDIGPRGGIYD